MANNRIFWAIEAVGIAPESTETYTDVHGLQSVGITTTFNLEEFFELGQISVYEQVEDIPDIEMTMERVLDGYPLAYVLGTRGSANSTLSGRQNAKSNIAMSLYGDTQDSASGVPITQVYMSGMQPTTVTYTIPVDGPCTESVTFVGNHKVWKNSNFTYTPTFDNTDEPLAISGSGGIQRREDILFDSLDDGSVSLLPGGTNGVEGISASGTNDKDSAGNFGAHIQSITISTDLGREELFELGRRAPYFRYVTFPVEVTCEIEVISTLGDQVSATEEGVLGNGNNLADKKILVVMRDGSKFDLGEKNRLQSTTFTGGDTSGSNATVTYSYRNFNDLDITHPQDPG